MTVCELQEHLKAYSPNADVWVMLAGRNFLQVGDVTAMGDEIHTSDMREDDCVLTLETGVTMPQKMMSPSPDMQRFGLSLPGFNSLVQHLANLLEQDGPKYAALVRDGLAVLAGVAGRDVDAILAALSAGNGDFKQIAQDILAEFGLS